MLLKLLEKIAALDRLEKVYRSVEDTVNLESFLDGALRALRVRVRLRGTTVAFPGQGPVIVVTNHPFGGLEGILLARILLGIRPDFKIMTNGLLERIAEVRPMLIGVDPFAHTGAAKRNVRPLRQCLKWLESVGALVVFPAGTVSHVHVQRRRIMDPPWNRTVARLALRIQCPVVPVCFKGRNSLLFQFMGLVHPSLRTLLLPRELLNKTGATVCVTVGNPVAFRNPASMEEARHAADYLRARTYALGLSAESNKFLRARDLISTQGAPLTPLRRKSPVAPPLPKERLVHDVR
ncbi:lysophospholipid acyltransferase family protein [Desulfosoma caldarium]|uniref:lysophospholipid acyltransferase family protein n=1 Tax=Desulfosoma caldarium TaxID=610254 RepID=UPI000F49F6FB|nr:lysophospholipid acyltransferase family protein [Desulfosoma caldarium]